MSVDGPTLHVGVSIIKKIGPVDWTLESNKHGLGDIQTGIFYAIFFRIPQNGHFERKFKVNCLYDLYKFPIPTIIYVYENVKKKSQNQNQF